MEHIIENHTWETVFKNATDDIDAYLESANAFSQFSQEGEPEAVIESLLTYRARIRSARQLIQNDLPNEYRYFKEKLETLWQMGEKILEEEAVQHRESIDAIINGHLINDLKRLNTELERVRRLVQDGFLFEDMEWIKDSLEEAASDFLLHFQDMYYIKEELAAEPFKNTVRSDKFIEFFNGIEIKFKSYFGYFSLTEAILKTLHEREYQRDNWWLTQKPDPGHIPEAQADETEIERLQDLVETVPDADESDCSMAESIISYALGEFDVNEAEDVYTHMLACRTCLLLFMDTLHTAKITSSTSHEPDVYPALLSAIGEKEASFASSDQRKDRPKLSEKLKNLIESLCAPKIYATAMACILVLGALFLFRWNSPPETLSGKIESIIYTAKRTRGGPPSVAPEILRDGGEMSSGAYYKVNVSLDKKAHVYVVLHNDLQGRTETLFKGELSAGKTTLSQNEKFGFLLDLFTGKETLYLIIAEKPIDAFSMKIENAKALGFDRLQDVFTTASIQTFTFHHTR